MKLKGMKYVRFSVEMYELLHLMTSIDIQTDLL